MAQHQRDTANYDTGSTGNLFRVLDLFLKIVKDYVERFHKCSYFKERYDFTVTFNEGTFIMRQYVQQNNVLLPNKLGVYIMILNIWHFDEVDFLQLLTLTMW